MGILVNALYNAFPGFAELERKTEETINQFNQAFSTGKRIGEYVVNNGDRIVNTLENALTKYLTGVITVIKDDFLQQYAKPKVEPMQKTEPATKAEPKTERKENNIVKNMKEKKADDKSSQTSQTSIDDLVHDFKQKLKQFNPGYDVKVDVYNNENVVKSYAAEHTISFKSSEAKTKYSKTKDSNLSTKVTELYNKGYRTKEIIKETVKQGYSGLRNYNDIAELVVAGIKSGMEYTRSNYNNAVATKLGAREQIINDYISGKSYKEIKENLKQRTNGMNISDSTICKIMHQYEDKIGKKVVGHRRNNNQKNKLKGKKKHS